MILDSLSLLKRSPTQSVLGRSSILEPQGARQIKNLVPVVILTSLIDAFSILVIYLLMNYSASGELMSLREGMELPKAANPLQIETAVIVQFHKGKYYVDDKETNNLVADLVAQRKILTKRAVTDKDIEFSLIVQSDKEVPYKNINVIIHASAQVGFDEVKFAVIKQ